MVNCRVGQHWAVCSENTETYFPFVEKYKISATHDENYFYRQLPSLAVVKILEPKYYEHVSAKNTNSTLLILCCVLDSTAIGMEFVAFSW